MKDHPLSIGYEPVDEHRRKRHDACGDYDDTDAECSEEQVIGCQDDSSEGPAFDTEPHLSLGHFLSFP